MLPIRAMISELWLDALAVLVLALFG